MREIKFRGKSLKTGEWVYGGYVRDALCDDNMIAEVGIVPNGCYPIAVKPETVGQFFGEFDENGESVCEGDIVKLTFDDGVTDNMVVVFDKGRFYMKGSGFWSFGSGSTAEEVIGNIHDNPELLESGNE